MKVKFLTNLIQKQWKIKKSLVKKLFYDGQAEREDHLIIMVRESVLHKQIMSQNPVTLKKIKESREAGLEGSHGKGN